MSQRFGVQRLVLLNSGGFRCADFDLTRAVHLAADNNAGKSTLVNALQFLFVDDFEKMVFGSHDLASTRHHYFGKAPSYIVFECLTHTGPQCLVVFGSGDIAGSRFSRLVYRGSFDRKHYEDETGRLADVTKLRQRLLSADVLELKGSRMWRVLCRPNDLRGDDEESARLGILPLKRVEDYHSFREVFIRLLGLSKATADDLKRLLIACSCQSVHATSVDVKRAYADQFTRLEHNDLELSWLKAVVPLIDQGISLRTALAGTNRRLVQTALEGRREMRRCGELERGLTLAVQRERDTIARQLQELRIRNNELRECLGKSKAGAEAIDRRMTELDAAHRRWEAMSDLELAAWKSRESALQGIIQETHAKLRETETHDVPSLERECDRKRQELEKRERELREWESRSAGYLNGLGFAPKQISKLFTLFNPDLARSSHSAVFGASDSKRVQSLIKRILATETGGAYQFDGVSVSTSSVHPASDLMSQSRDVVVEQVRFLKQEVARITAIVEVARDIKATRTTLQQDEAELVALSSKLRENSDHFVQYARRPELVAESRSLTKVIEETKEAIAVADREEVEWTEKSTELRSAENDLKRSAMCRTNLASQLREIEIGDADDFRSEVVEPVDDALQLKAQLQKSCDEIEKLTRTLATLDRSRSETLGKVGVIQQAIAAEARKQRAPRVAIFDQDVEREWRDLESLRETLEENEQRLTTLWNALFKSLAGELDLLRRSVAEIKKRASRINADFKKYRVSNLESVELHVDHDTSAYTTIERMTSADSMFLKDGDVEDAKLELRQWIMDGKTIELRELFAIRIRIHNFGDPRPVEVASLDVIGSEGTGMTAKVMIYLQLLRSIIDDQNGEYQMHFYLDEIGKLDDRNLRATTEMASRRGFTPITAEPEPRAEALAHPEVRIYHLGMHEKCLEIVQKLTYVARAKAGAQKAST